MAVEKKKLLLEEDITMTGCLNAVKKLRNCAICPHRFNHEECKAQKCVPQVVVDRIMFAVREHFYGIKQAKKVNQEIIPPGDNEVDKLRI